MTSPVIKVGSDSWNPLIFSLLILKADDRKRLKLANDKVAADYVITNYRGVRDTNKASYSQDYEMFYEKRVDHEVILSVFKWKESR
jgi:hypothetical protein